MSIDMNYIPLYLQQTLPIVSQQCHWITSDMLVNDQVLERDLVRWYNKFSNHKHGKSCRCSGDHFEWLYDAPKILISHCTRNRMNKTEILHNVIKNSNIKTLRYILTHYNINIDARDKYGETALMMVCGYTYIKNGLEIAKCLVEHGASTTIKNRGLDPINLASESNNKLDLFEYLLSVTSNAQEIINTRYNNGNTLLTEAFKYRPCKYIQCLLKYGADIKTCNNNNNTLLIEACLDVAPIENVQCIIEHSIKQYGKEATATFVNYKAGYNSALWIACNKNSNHLVKYLVTIEGINMNITGPHGNTPLIEACKHNNISMIIDLVNNGANVNAVNDDGETPLMTACMHKLSMSKIQYLVNSGADITYNNNGRTALSIARHHHLNEVVEYLENKLNTM